MQATQVADTLLDSFLKNGSSVALLLLGIYYFIRENDKKNTVAMQDKTEIVALLKGVIVENTAAMNRIADAWEEMRHHITPPTKK